MQPKDEMVGARMTEYSPEAIKEITEILAPQSTNYANAISEQIGQAQQSMGPLATATMGQSQTAGLGNYTYNRLLRPTVDTLRDEILVEGYKDSLNALLNNALRTAKKNYESSGSSSTTTQKSGWDGSYSEGGSSSNFWKKGTYNDKQAVYGLYILKRPNNMTDNDEWYAYAENWIADQAFKDGDR